MIVGIVIAYELNTPQKRHSEWCVFFLLWVLGQDTSDGSAPTLPEKQHNVNIRPGISKVANVWEQRIQDDNKEMEGREGYLKIT